MQILNQLLSEKKEQKPSPEWWWWDPEGGIKRIRALFIFSVPCAKKKLTISNVLVCRKYADASKHARVDKHNINLDPRMTPPPFFQYIAMSHRGGGGLLQQKTLARAKSDYTGHLLDP